MNAMISLKSVDYKSIYGVWYDYDTAVFNSDYSNWADVNDHDYFGDGSVLGSMLLYEDGCRVNSTSWDCTWACSRPDQVWASTYTLHNCVLYPIIAQLIHNGTAINGRHDMTIANKYNILGDPNSDLYNGWPVIETCITDYCSQSEHTGCGGDGSLIPITYLPPGDQTEDPRFFKSTTIRSDLCIGLDAVINPDIGGIGMFVSYIMQIGIVIFSWVAWHFLEHWTRLFAFVHHRYLGNRLSHVESWSTAGKKQKGLKESKVHGSLVTALSDFQKAQIWFMLAVQIACLIALNNPTYLASSNWQQFWNNIGVLFDLAFGGIFPVLLTLLMLRQTGEKGSFVLLVTTCCVGVAAGTWFSTWKYMNSYPADILQRIKSTGPASCNNIAPVQYCYQDDWFYSNSVASTKGIGMLVFALVVQLCMIVDQVRVFAVSEHSHPKRQNSFEVSREWLGRANSWDSYKSLVEENRWFRPLQRLRLHEGRDFLLAIERVVIFGTEVALVAFTCVLLEDYAPLLLPDNYVVLKFTDWSLGQVIAVTIWVPVLFLFVWECFGHKRGEGEKSGDDLDNDSWAPGRQGTDHSGASEPGEVLSPLKTDASYAHVRETRSESSS